MEIHLVKWKTFFLVNMHKIRTNLCEMSQLTEIVNCTIITYGQIWH